MALFDRGLLPASFRGAPFAVTAQELGGGRRIVLHQYPGRETPWSEDMGRAPRVFRMRGFIVDGDVLFAGGPIRLQRLLLVAALEKSGPGVLTHPTLGILNVTVTRFSIGEELSAGQASTVEIEFLEAGKRLYPSLLTGSGLLSAANLVLASQVIDAVRVIALASRAGGRRRDLNTTAARWSSQVVSLGRDATALHRLVAKLPGNNGRYASGANAGVDGAGAGIDPTADVPSLAAAAAAARGAILLAASTLAATIIAVDLDRADAVANAAAQLVASLASACADPADTIRLLLALLAFDPGRAAATTAIGVAFSVVVMRAAAAELTRAVALYQPSSADDAAATIQVVGSAIDVAATAAADAGDDESFAALRGARGAIVQDLRRRGATLARIRTYRFGASLPAPYLAQRLYRDGTRADQLVTQVTENPHPLFMPNTFQALAS